MLRGTRSLHLDICDYENNIVCNLYDNQSDISGQATDVFVKTERNGWKELSFTIPTTCMTMEGKEENYRLQYLIADYRIRLKTDNKTDYYLISEPRIIHNGPSKNVEVIAGHISQLLKTKNLGLEFSDEEGNNVGTASELLQTILDGTGWTVAGMIAQTSGVNMKVDIDGNTYTGFSSFLGGVTNLGDILKANGYSNHILMGSDAKFGGRDELFSQHGDYEILDLIEMRERGKLPYDYMTWWGYEDAKLFAYAKEKLTEVSKSDEPFNVTLLTADTHFQDGYVEDGCPELFDKQYANVFHCSDSMIAKFVEWIQKQDFGKDTTIIITGDHLSMQRDFYKEDGYDRTVFNTIINPRATPVREKDRAFTSLDMFPTTLAALGVDIQGDRLALGTNLFSGRDTLLEELGFDQFDGELSKRSNFYNNNLLGDSYYEIKKQIDLSK